MWWAQTLWCSPINRGCRKKCLSSGRDYVSLLDCRINLLLRYLHLSPPASTKQKTKTQRNANDFPVKIGKKPNSVMTLSLASSALSYQCEELFCCGREGLWLIRSKQFNCRRLIWLWHIDDMWKKIVIHSAIFVFCDRLDKKQQIFYGGWEIIGSLWPGMLNREIQKLEAITTAIFANSKMHSVSIYNCKTLPTLRVIRSIQQIHPIKFIKIKPVKICININK